jgi:hypothetical protein
MAEASSFLGEVSLMAINSLSEEFSKSSRNKIGKPLSEPVSFYSLAGLLLKQGASPRSPVFKFKLNLVTLHFFAGPSIVGLAASP